MLIYLLVFFLFFFSFFVSLNIIHKASLHGQKYENCLASNESHPCGTVLVHDDTARTTNKSGRGPGSNPRARPCRGLLQRLWYNIVRAKRGPDYTKITIVSSLKTLTYCPSGRARRPFVNPETSGKGPQRLSDFLARRRRRRRTAKESTISAICHASDSLVELSVPGFRVRRVGETTSKSETSRAASSILFHG